MINIYVVVRTVCNSLFYEWLNIIPMIINTVQGGEKDEFDLMSLILEFCERLRYTGS